MYNSWKWFKESRLLKYFKVSECYPGPNDKVYHVPEAKAEQLNAFCQDFTMWHANRSNRAWYEYQKVAVENEQLRFKLDWLMKQPALQHYAVQLDVGEPRPKLECGEEPKPPKFDE